MKLLHQLGHNFKWNLDAYFENKIGDGFIFCARSFSPSQLGSKISGYEGKEYLPVSLVDLQFYGGKKSNGTCLEKYEFHPLHLLVEGKTEVSIIENIFKAIEFQRNLGIKNILIPQICEPENSETFIKIAQSINGILKSRKEEGVKYYMTLPLHINFVQDDEIVEKILIAFTDKSIVFDGFYLACEQNMGTKKISTDFKYYITLSKVLRVLKDQNFETILGFSNIDALVFSSLADIDYVSIGTYENLRSFDPKRFVEEKSGGGSKGWYFSEKLLNFVKSSELDIIRNQNCLDLISNEDNIFSDIILNPGYVWNIHKPDVQKNYLLSASKLLEELSQLSSLQDRKEILKQKIKEARETYKELEARGVFLSEESSGYHLTTWLSALEIKL